MKTLRQLKSDKEQYEMAYKESMNFYESIICLGVKTVTLDTKNKIVICEYINNAKNKVWSVTEFLIKLVHNGYEFKYDNMRQAMEFIEGELLSYCEIREMGFIIL